MTTPPRTICSASSPAAAGRVPWRRLAALGLNLILGCERPATEIVVRVDSEIPWGAGQRLQSVVLEVRRAGPTGPLRSRQVTVVGAAGRPLPLFVGLSETAGDTTPLWIEALGCTQTSGCGRDNALSAQRALVRFVPQQTLELTMLLSGACVVGRCTVDQRCTPTGDCRAAASAQDSLRPIPAIPPDAASVADATVSDSIVADTPTDTPAPTDQLDASAPMDVATPTDVVDASDASVDVPGRDLVSDVGAPDAAVDLGPADTGPRDVVPGDAGPSDTGPSDTGPLDAGPLDTGRSDTGPLDSGSLVCGTGFELLGGACVSASAPRPVAPLSLGDASLLRPTMRWVLPSGMDGATVEFCRDRLCSMSITTLRASGTSIQAPSGLAARSVVFWRLRGTLGMATSARVSPTWLFHVPSTNNSNNVDTSSNAHLDVNGDGFDDVAVGSILASPGTPTRRSAGAVSVFHGSSSGPAMTFASRLEGVAIDDNFGTSVAGAGDVNGDGFGDLVVGTPSADPGGRGSAGTATVYLGSSSGVQTASPVVLEGGDPNTYFGGSVAGAGDVNGDGFGDLVVGASGVDLPARSNGGTVSVFHGSALGISTAATIVLEGTMAEMLFGDAVASAGDVNGDGFSDIVIGSSLGFASVFRGSAAGVPMVATQVLSGVAMQGTSFGTAVASAGDANGDGYDDLVVGAKSAAPGGRMTAGSVSVYHGATGPLGTGASNSPDRVLEGQIIGGQFGFAVASARDVNGDGYGDLIVGSTLASPAGRSAAGRASVFLGSRTGLPTTVARDFDGAAPGDRSGSTVGGGDVNGDGYGDFFIGAHAAAYLARGNVGIVSVYLGNSTVFPTTPALVLGGQVPGEFFGRTVASVRSADGPRPGGPLVSLFWPPPTNRAESPRWLGI